MHAVIRYRIIVHALHARTERRLQGSGTGWIAPSPWYKPLRRTSPWYNLNCTGGGCRICNPPDSSRPLSVRAWRPSGPTSSLKRLKPGDGVESQSKSYPPETARVGPRGSLRWPPGAGVARACVLGRGQTPRTPLGTIGLGPHAESQVRGPAPARATARQAPPPLAIFGPKMGSGGGGVLANGAEPGRDTRSPARHPGRRGHGHGAHFFPRAVRPVGIGVARGAMHAPPARLAAVAPPFRGRARRLVAQGPCLAATDFRMCLGAGLWTPTGHRAAVSALCLRLVFK